MRQQVEAIYENGLLRPLQPLELKESDRVYLTVSPNAADDMVDHTLLAYAKARVAALDYIPTHEEVRENLSKIKESMSELIISERGAY